MAELEKLGSKFRVAQRIAKDPRFERLPCTHKGTYADDCLVNRVMQVYAVYRATTTNVRFLIRCFLIILPLLTALLPLILMLFAILLL